MNGFAVHNYIREEVFNFDRSIYLKNHLLICLKNTGQSAPLFRLYAFSQQLVLSYDTTLSLIKRIRMQR